MDTKTLSKSFRFALKITKIDVEIAMFEKNVKDCVTGNKMYNRLSRR